MGDVPLAIPRELICRAVPRDIHLNQVHTRLMLTNVFSLLPVALALLAALANPAMARNAFCPSSGICRDSLALSSGGTIQYYRSAPLGRNAAIARAVVVVHGNQRDADRYYDRIVHAAASETDSRDVLLLAPNFRTLKDRPGFREHYWSAHGWKIGNKSLDSKRISSFTVMDELLARLCSIGPAEYPGLKTIVIVGHSAGGQFVNRYAAGGTDCANPAIEVRYVVMNPSSYLYLDGRRRPDVEEGFEASARGCRDYDDYKYGLQDLNSYMKRVGVAQLRARLLARRTYYLAGEDDTRRGSSLDTSCEANLQGANRLARFRNYRDYSGLFKSWTSSEFISIPGVGHDGGRMLASDAARRIIFH